MPRSAGSSFATGFYGNLPLQDVEIIHAIGSPDERRFQTQALINKGDGAFAVDTPIYEGDIVELDDPRGGRRQLVVDEIDIYDMRSNSAFAGMSRITAKWVPSNRKHAKLDEVQALSQTVSNYHGPVITVHGDGARLAWSKTGNVTQNNVQEVALALRPLPTQWPRHWSTLRTLLIWQTRTARSRKRLELRSSLRWSVPSQTGLPFGDSWRPCVGLSRQSSCRLLRMPVRRG